MEKSIYIALILFSASVCFSQNSELHVKDISSTTSTSKSGLEPNVKAPLQEEVIGRPAMINLGTPIIEPFNSSSEISDQKKSINGKKVTKPH